MKEPGQTAQTQATLRHREQTWTQLNRAQANEPKVQTAVCQSRTATGEEVEPEPTANLHTKTGRTKQN